MKVVGCWEGTSPILHCRESVGREYLLGVLIIGWRRIPLHYTLFALTLACIALSFPIYDIEPLTSLPRYMLVAFPVTIICALWGKHPRFDAFYTAFALPLFALITIMFVVGFWVA